MGQVLKGVYRSFEVQWIIVVDWNRGNLLHEPGSAHAAKPVVLWIGMTTLLTTHIRDTSGSSSHELDSKLLPRAFCNSGKSRKSRVDGSNYEVPEPQAKAFFAIAFDCRENKEIK
jgi:hypothetical protein